MDGQQHKKRVGKQTDGITERMAREAEMNRVSWLMVLSLKIKRSGLLEYINITSHKHSQIKIKEILNHSRYYSN